MITLYDDFVRAALEAAFPRRWTDWMPDFAATAVDEGVGVLTSYHSEIFRVTTGVLTGLAPSQELLAEVAAINAQLPIGSVFLGQGGDGWVTIWTYKILMRWFDPESVATKQMVLDVLANAETMTNMVGQRLQPAFGGERFSTGPGWETAVMSFI